MKRNQKMSETTLANRLSNAKRSMQHLEKATSMPLDAPLNMPLADWEMINLNATVHLFNVTFEVLMKALNVYFDEKLKLRHEQRSNSYRLLQSAYQNHFIDDEKIWIGILNARNATVHEYNEEQTMGLYQAIKSYVSHLSALLNRLTEI